MNGVFIVVMLPIFGNAMSEALVAMLPPWL